MAEDQRDPLNGASVTLPFGYEMAIVSASLDGCRWEVRKCERSDGRAEARVTPSPLLHGIEQSVILKAIDVAADVARGTCSDPVKAARLVAEAAQEAARVLASPPPSGGAAGPDGWRSATAA